MFVSDDIVTSPDGLTLSAPGGQAWSHRSCVSASVMGHDVITVVPVPRSEEAASLIISPEIYLSSYIYT